MIPVAGSSAGQLPLPISSHESCADCWACPAVRLAAPKLHETAIVFNSNCRHDFSIDYLDTLISEVRLAVDDGQTLEQTVASVTMDAYQGYGLWDFVHSVINVPKTYAELSQQ